MEENFALVPPLLPLEKKKMKALLTLILIFSRTFGYYLQSFFQPHRILEIKQAWACYALKKLGYTLTETGERPDSTDGLILVGNHISFLDIIVLMATSPQITFLAKKEVRSWPIIGMAAVRVKTIFIDRSPSADRTKARLEVAKQIQQNQAYVTVFPSGTTSLFENKPWKKGIFEISQAHQVPVKAFKLTYDPLRESAYIDDDHLITQMLHILRIQKKKVNLTWLQTYKIEDPEKSAEQIREHVQLA